MNVAGESLNLGDHGLIAQQIRDFEFRIPRLTRAQQFTGPADLQVFLRNHKTVVAVAQHLQTHLGGFRERRFVEQDAVGRYRATADAPAKLVELGKAQALRVFDNHQAGVRHIHAHFDDRGRDQQMQLALFERLHHRLLFSGLHASVNQTHV